MATKKISEFTNLGSLSDSDILPVVSNGSNKKITASVLKTYAQAGGGTSLPTDAQGFLKNDGSGTLSWASAPASLLSPDGTYEVTLDDTGALVLSSYGVVKNPDHVNMVSDGWVQMQWVDTNTLENADPNSTSGPSNWIYVDNSGIHVETNINGNIGDSTTRYNWQFDIYGNLQMPEGGDIKDVNGNSVLGGGGGNPFDQNLNTTDSVTFTGLTLDGNITSPNGSEFITQNGSGGSIDIYTDWTGNGVEVWLQHGDRVAIKTENGTYAWDFDNAGKLLLPENGQGLGWINSDSAPTPDTGFLYSSTISFDKTQGILLTNNVGGTDISLVLGTNGTLTLDGGATIIPKIQGTNSIDIKAGTGGWAELLSHNEQNYIWVDDTASHIGAGLAEWTFGSDGYIEVSSTKGLKSHGGGSQKLHFDTDGVHIVANSHNWVFGDNGNLKLPAGGDIVDSNGNSVLGGSGNVPTNLSELTNDVGFITTWGQADWNEQITESPSYIQNKPFIPTSLSDFGITAGSDGQVLTLNSSLTPVWTTLNGGTNTGNITFNGDTIGSTNDIVDINASNYSQISSNDSYVWVESGNASIEVDGNTWIFSGGDLEAPGKVLAAQSEGTYNGGFSFTGNEGGRDSGMFSATDGVVNFFANAQQVFNITTAGLQLNKDLDVNGNNIVSNGYAWTFDGNGNLTLPEGGDIKDVNGNSVLGGGGTTDRLVNGSYSFILNEHGGIDTTNGTVGPTLAGEFGFGANTGADAVIKANGGFSTWTFKTDNTLQLPAGGDIVDSNGNSVLGGGSGTTNEITNTDGYNLFKVSVADTGVISMNTIRGGLEFGAMPEVGAPNHLHIMRPAGQEGSTDLFFGDDYNYVRLPGLYGAGTQGVEIGSSFNSGAVSTWKFDTNGTFTPGSDNLQDIGTPTNRVRHIYVGPGSISIGDSVLSESNSGKLVLPGLTRGTGYTVVEIEDTADQTQTFSSSPVVIDYGYYLFMNGSINPPGYVPASYYVVGLDGDGYIDRIDISSGGEGFDESVAAILRANNMLAYTGSQDPIGNWNQNDWVSIPFKARVKAGDVEYEFNTGGGSSALEGLDDVQLDGPSNGQVLTWNSSQEKWENQNPQGGGNANTGDVLFETNTLYVNNGDFNTGFLNLQNDEGQVVIGSNNDSPLKISLNENGTAKEWIFGTDGSITFPDATTQTTAYTGGASSGVTGLAGSNENPGGSGELSYTLSIDTDNQDNTVYLRTYQGDSGSNPSIQLGRMDQSSRGQNAIAIGNDDVGYQQGAGSIAIGYQAGWADINGLGENSIAIGTRAAYNSANSNSIILNATGSDLDADQSGLFVKPVREDTNNTTKAMYYNTSSGEMTYADPAGGSSTKTWTTPNSNAWRIEEYSGGWAGGYDFPIAEMSYTLVESQTDANYFFIDTSAYPEQWQAIQWAEEYVINGVTVSASGYGVTSFPNYNVSLGGNVTYSSGDTVTIRYRNRNASPEAQVWWDAANSNSGNENFRGAIIEYHAYCGNSGTIVGKIIIACDNNMAVSHEETIMGGDLAQYEFWMQGDTGQLKVRRIGSDANNDDNQIWIQWTGKIFYGSDYYC